MGMPSLSHKPSKGYKRLRSVLTFLLALILFVAVFGTVGLWAINTYAGQRAGKMPLSGASEAAQPLREGEGEPVHHLLVVSAQTDTVDGLLVVRMDAAAGTLSVLAVPPETEAASSTAFVTLASLYEDGGRQAMERLCGALSDILDVSLTKYLIVTGGSITELLDYFGSNPAFTVPEAVQYEGSLSVQLEAGEQTLSAGQIQGLLLYPAALWSGGRQQYAAVRAALLCAMYNQYATAARLSEAEADFKALVNAAASTNLLISDFYAARGAVEALRRQNVGELCTWSVLSGEFVGRGDDVRFYPAEH